ncbi:hypothetical protein C4J98_0282 [Pseudomonas orientalis]|nr:hypothetical protein C4J98_0282 [Pseudomonas orientalis]
MQTLWFFALAVFFPHFHRSKAPHKQCTKEGHKIDHLPFIQNSIANSTKIMTLATLLSQNAPNKDA